MKKKITQQQFIDQLEKEVLKIYKTREKDKKGSWIDLVGFGNQSGLLYVVDQLKHVVEITRI
jgi:hypothetical protein